MQSESRSSQPVRSTPRTAPRRRLSVDRRRDELIEAALDLLSKRGPDDVSVDDVAQAAGASRALVYHYFGTKQELYAAALSKAAAELTRRLAQVEPGDTPLQRLDRAVRAFVEFAEAHSAGFVALLGGSAAYGSGAESAALVHSVEDTVYELLVEGLSEPTPVDPLVRMTLKCWVAAAETAVLDWLKHQDLARTDIEQQLIVQLGALLMAIGHEVPV
ncbi:TetR/AcrR family transcriptional regulator [Catenulispora sp. GAS73]|uniref:TetR/AcrR family transcriptional regulator n=1 Tax=Catenulispora sp. GAS73 TaxID=3156269 RepID=UPI00351436B5